MFYVGSFASQASYFNQVPEDLVKQHLKAIQAIRDLKQSDLTLRIETKGDSGSTEVTYIKTGTKSGLLHSQIKNLQIPEGSSLSRVKVFSSLDGEIALNVFTFQNSQVDKELASPADATAIFELINEIRQGVHSSNPSMPKDSALFDDAAMKDYLTRVSSSYASLSSARRFLVQRLLFEQVFDVK